MNKYFVNKNVHPFYFLWLKLKFTLKNWSYMRKKYTIDK